MTGRDSEASMRDALVSSNHSSATAHLGINMHNFPNMFILMGPNTVLAHNSVIFMLECQVDYVINALKQMMVMSVQNKSGLGSFSKKILPILGLQRPTIYQINGNLMGILLNFRDLR